VGHGLHERDGRDDLRRADQRHVDELSEKALSKVGNGTVSTVAYNSNSAQYMVATSDGHMAYISASDVGTDADGFE
jgi:hypothetical protein